MKDRDRVLDCKLREDVYKYIVKHPGVSMTQIRRGLSLLNGTLSYHLHALGKHGYIKSARLTLVRCYYPSGARIDVMDLLTPLQRDAVVYVREHPDATTDDVMAAVVRAHGVVSTALRRLTALGLLERRSVNRVTYRVVSEKFGPESGEAYRCPA